MYNKLSNILYQNNKKLKTYYEPDDEEEIRPFNIDEYKENDIVEKPSIIPLSIFRSLEDDDLDAKPVKVKDEINNNDIQPKITQINSFQSNTEPNQYHYELNRFNNISGDDLITREAHEEANDNANFSNAKSDLVDRLFEGDDDKADQQMIQYLLKNDVKAQEILEQKKPAKKLDIKDIPIDDVNYILSTDPDYQTTKDKRKVGNIKKYIEEKEGLLEYADEYFNSPTEEFSKKYLKQQKKRFHKKRAKAQRHRIKKEDRIGNLINEDIDNEYKAYIDEVVRDGASTQIQKVARGRKARKQAEDIRNIQQAYKDQNKLVIRDIQNKNNTQSRAKQKDKELKLKVQEQNQMLGEDLVSQRVRSNKEMEMMEAEDLPLQKRKNASTIISKFERGRQARKQAEQLRNTEQQNKASTQIQRVARGYKGRKQAEKARKDKTYMDMYLGKYDEPDIPIAEVIENLPDEEVKEQEFSVIDTEIKAKNDEYEAKVGEINEIFTKRGTQAEEYIKAKSTKYKFDELWNTYKYMLYKQGKNKEILKIQNQINREEKVARRNRTITREFLISAISNDIEY